MNGVRWRLVDTQNGNRYVSSVVLTQEEAEEHLEFEQMLHEAAGWTVTPGDLLFVARNPRGLVRVVEARAFGPLDDAMSA